MGKSVLGAPFNIITVAFPYKDSYNSNVINSDIKAIILSNLSGIAFCKLLDEIT